MLGASRSVLVFGIVACWMCAAACSTEGDSSSDTSQSQSDGGNRCGIAFTVTSRWDGGYSADVRVTNNTGRPLSGWQFSLRFPNGQTLRESWNGRGVQTGDRVTFSPATWNSEVPPGGEFQVGFTATGVPDSPIDYAINGISCAAPMKANGDGAGVNPPTGATPATGPDGGRSAGSEPSGSGGGSSTSDERQAMATHFDGLGFPTGGCGVPEGALETPNFVALNVQNTPNDYTSFLPRPIGDAAKLGEFNNGKNCGRWVRVTIGDICGVANDGAPGAGFCKGGAWKGDGFNGATLDMIVADSCQDGNGWCRDDRYHLDLSTSSLGRFAKDGKPVSGLSSAWNNRKISWHYIDAPNYAGDIKLGFRKDAKSDWNAIVITHLKNGISGIDAAVGGKFVDVPTVGDNGQSFALPFNADRPFRIRVRDVNGTAINNSRVYKFEYPTACGIRCTEPFTEVKYQTE